MALATIVDESRSDRTATVFSNKALKVGERYSYYAIPSGTATAAIFSGTGVLHSIIATVSAATTSLYFFDSKTAGAIGATASAVAKFDSISRGTLLFDAILGSGLTYRLSAADANGIVIVYASGD